MKRAVVMCLLLLGVRADAGEPRKSKPQKLVEAASQAFDAAMTFEDKGKLDEALAEYRRSYELMPHANTIFNMAQIHIRQLMYTAAIAELEEYLLRDPKASDRKVVEAKIKTLIETPATIQLSVPDGVDPDKADVYVISDGTIVRKPREKAPASIVLSHGVHSLDYVGAIAFRGHDIDVRGLDKVDKRAVGASSKARADGTVLIRVNDIGSYLQVRFRGETIKDGALLAVPPGSYRVVVADRRYECPPITVEVPKQKSKVVYVHLAPAEQPKLETLGPYPQHCRALTVTQQVLSF